MLEYIRCNTSIKNYVLLILNYYLVLAKMGQTNSTQRELEARGPGYEPIARFDEFGRITNFYYDDFNRLQLGRNPNPRRAYWKKGERIGHLYPYFKHLAYN